MWPRINNQKILNPVLLVYFNSYEFIIKTSLFLQDKRKLAEFEGDGSSSGEGSGSAQCYNSKTGEILGRTFRKDNYQNSNKSYLNSIVD